MGKHIKSLLLLTLFQEVYYLSFHWPSIQLFISIWIKSHISFSSTCFCYYRKHPNNDNKICSLLCSTCFKQHFHDCFLYLGTIQIWGNFIWHCHYLTWTKSVICQIDPNCSPFQSLNMLSFHIRHERLKVIYNGLISHFFKYYFKTGTFASFSYLHICLLL